MGLGRSGKNGLAMSQSLARFIQATNGSLCRTNGFVAVTVLDSVLSLFCGTHSKTPEMLTINGRLRGRLADAVIRGPIG